MIRIFSQGRRIDWKAVQSGSARTSCRRYGGRPVDASGGVALLDRHSDGRGVGSAEALEGRSPAGQATQAEVLDAHADFILGALRERPDLTLDEMVDRLVTERNVKVARRAVWKFRVWCKQMPSPTLRPCDIVIMDNLAAPRSTASAKSSKHAGQRCSTCRPTVPISIPSRCANFFAHPGYGQE